MVRGATIGSVWQAMRWVKEMQKDCRTGPR